MHLLQDWFQIWKILSKEVKVHFALTLVYTMMTLQSVLVQVYTMQSGDGPHDAEGRRDTLFIMAMG